MFLFHMWRSTDRLLSGHNELPIENMEMVDNSVELHKQNATDKELPIQFCGTMTACGLVLSLALLLSSAPEFTKGGRISF